MTEMKNRDSRLLQWDPETIDLYWQMCHTFDDLVTLNCEEAEVLSQKAYLVAGSVERQFTHRTVGAEEKRGYLLVQRSFTFFENHKPNPGGEVPNSTNGSDT